jgi:hypothetical protein
LEKRESARWTWRARGPRHFGPVLVARLILAVLALIGVIAIALLVLGLL